MPDGLILSDGSQPGLCFHSGNLSQSRLLALQLKRRMESLPMSVYQPAATG